jgi:hypothetical protein
MSYPIDIEIEEPHAEVIEQVLTELEQCVQEIGDRWKRTEDRIVHTADLDDLLADHQAIAIVWDISHVKDQRPDLTEEQAWEVLRAIEHDRLNDPMLETIRLVAENLYPGGKETLRRRVKSLLAEIEALPERESDNPAAYGEAAVKLDMIEINAKGI